MRQLADTIQKHIRALKLLGQPTESWDALLLYLLSSKLDLVTRREWETKNSIKTHDPTFVEFCENLNQKCQILEAVAGQLPETAKQSSPINTYAISNNKLLHSSRFATKQRTDPNTLFNKPPFSATHGARHYTHSNISSPRQAT